MDGETSFSHLGIVLIYSFFAVVTAVEEENRVGFETSSFSITCSSKVAPMWSWVGKNANHIKSMAIGSKKQIRFVEPR